MTVKEAVADSPDSVAQVTTCLPGFISSVNGARPTVSPAGAPSANHQRRSSGATSPAWQTTR